MIEPQLRITHYTRLLHRMYALVHDSLPLESVKRARRVKDTQQKKESAR